MKKQKMLCTFYTKGFVVFSTLLFNIIISAAQVSHADDRRGSSVKTSEAVATTTATNLHKIDGDDKNVRTDLDMLMQPNDFHSIGLLRSVDHANFNQLRVQQQQQQHHPFHEGILSAPFAARSFALPSPPSRSVTTSPDSHKSPAAQSYFPSFLHNAPPLGHSRPYLGSIQQHVEHVAGLGLPSPSPHSNYDSLLGSGDFGVLRGGTFYPEDEMPYHLDDHTNFDPYFGGGGGSGGDAHNGHGGRPSGEDGFVHTYTYPEEQFANFRDFADINTPADTAFSQFAVVYAATQNASRPHTYTHATHSVQPKNIFEKLEMLDKEQALEDAKKKPMDEKKKKKFTSSKAKSKFHKTKLEEKKLKNSTPPNQSNQSNMDNEPLLALS